MSVVNKPEIIAQIAEKTGKSKADTARFLEAFEDVVTDSVSEGSEVKLSGFASFAPAVRSARTMRSPQTGEPIEVPEKKFVRVKVLKTFRDKVEGA